MKRLRIIFSIMSLAFAFMVLGVFGVIALMNVTYGLDGTVSYTAYHINSTIEITKSKSKLSTTMDDINDDLQNPLLYEVDTQWTKEFNDTQDAGRDTKTDSVAFDFSAEVIAYKLEIKVINKSNFSMRVNITATEDKVNNNWFLYTFKANGNQVDLADGEFTTITVYVGLVDLTQSINVDLNKFSISIDMEKSPVTSPD